MGALMEARDTAQWQLAAEEKRMHSPVVIMAFKFFGLSCSEMPKPIAISSVPSERRRSDRLLFAPLGDVKDVCIDCKWFVQHLDYRHFLYIKDLWLLATLQIHLTI